MSTPALYRSPAWRGLNPLPHLYVPADPGLAQEVAIALGRKGIVSRLQNAGGAASIFLRMDDLDGRSWFLKVVRGGHARELQAAEALAQWLTAEGVRVVVAETGVELGGGRSLWSYPYHSGRPPDSNIEDMRVIGTELGRLHLALGRHFSLPEWRARTATRLVRLSAVREALASGVLRAGPEPDFLRRIAHDRSVDFLPQRYATVDGCLALHGDLNRFNLLIDSRGCTLLDFEDVCHSVLPPIFDLAMIAERVALFGKEPASTHSLVDALFSAYAAVTGCLPDISQIPDVRRGLALRSLCTLAECDPAGRDDQEWQKFFRLLLEVDAPRDANTSRGVAS